jgi:hypothetical protein
MANYQIAISGILHVVAYKHKLTAVSPDHTWCTIRRQSRQFLYWDIKTSQHLDFFI